ncbi:hypothetical protein TrST_g4889 [Triparma strigata]|uniref:Uncharacterized protein n=1 Tax=Triparma strigata TaxID=1606541 RepID=A0A9W7E6R5_9STRA|nr:hypothetical protein TrST_g4889 [Triparma strigata]
MAKGGVRRPQSAGRLQPSLDGSLVSLPSGSLGMDSFVKSARPKSAKAKMSRSKDQTFNTLKTNYTGESWDQGSAQWSVPSMPSMVIKILPEATMMLHKSGRRKASPETPLSAPTQSENFKVKNTMRVMDDFEKRRERFDSSQGDVLDIQSSTMKAQVEGKLKKLSQTVSNAVKRHNSLQSKKQKGKEAEKEEGEMGNQKDHESRPGSPPKTRPKSAAQKLSRGKTMMRPKSAPLGRDAQQSSLNQPASRVERKIWEVKQERVNQQLEKKKAEQKADWVAKANKDNNSKTKERPQTANATTRTGTSAFEAPEKMKSKARPRSAAMADRARNRKTTKREKATIVMELLGSVAGNTLAATLMSKDMKSEILKMGQEKRNLKQKTFKKRRKDMEKKRLDDIYAKDWNLRMERLKSENLGKQNKMKRQESFLKYIVLGHAQAILKKKLYSAWFEKDLEKKKQASAEVITRQIRLYSYRCYRKKVRGAIKVLGAFFIIRIKIWKKRRDHRCADLILDFLGKLKAENDRTGGIFKLVAKGERLKAYKRDIILIQRNWRRKKRNIEAQVQFVDRQWTTYQDFAIDAEVDRLHDQATLDLVEENEEIERKNKGRKLMNKRAIARILPPPKHVFREKLLESDDVLENKYTTPKEIRLKIVRCYLRWAKRELCTDLLEWKVKHERWEELIKMHTRRGVFVKNFTTKEKNEEEEEEEEDEEELARQKAEEEAQEKFENEELTQAEKIRAMRSRRGRTHTVAHSGVAKINYKGREKTMSFMKSDDDEVDHSALKEPTKPTFKTLLTGVGIRALHEAGTEYLRALREMWDPKIPSSYIDENGKLQFKEMPTFDELGKKVSTRQSQAIRDANMFN